MFPFFCMSVNLTIFTLLIFPSGILFANCANPDQTVPMEQSDLGLHSLLRHYKLNFCGKYCISCPVRRGNRDNLGINIPYFSMKTYCDPSLESSHGSNEGSHCMFSLRNKKNYL